MISFTVHGIPAPKGRPRVVRNPRTGRVTTFTPERTLSYESAVGLAARAAGAKPLQGPVAVVLAFFLPDCRRLDIDNLEKTVLDGLNGIAWADDSQVCWVMKAKYLDAKAPRVLVRVRPADELLDGLEYPVCKPKTRKAAVGAVRGVG